MDKKQVYENQETAIKLLEENVELKKRIKEAREYIEENIIGNYFKRYDDEIYRCCDDILEILEGEVK